VYHWAKDGNLIPDVSLTSTSPALGATSPSHKATYTGPTGPTLVITRVTEADFGAYQCVVHNVNGSVTSETAMVTMLASPPSIIVQPRSTIVRMGEPMSISVEGGSAWVREGVPLRHRDESRHVATAACVLVLTLVCA
jgi:hypothetical protein